MIRVFLAPLLHKLLSLVVSIQLQYCPGSDYPCRPIHEHSQIRLPEPDLLDWRAEDYRHVVLRKLEEE